MKNKTSIYTVLLLLVIIFLSNKSYSKERINGIGFFFSGTSYSKIKNNTLMDFQSNTEYFFSRRWNWNEKSNSAVTNIVQNPITFSDKDDSIKRQNELNPIVAKRLFFGKVFSYGLPPAPEIGPCKVGVFMTYYFFGMKISGPRPVMIPLKKNKRVLIQQVVTCGTEYPPVKSVEKDVKLESKEEKPERKEDF
jgi:hypothetical protein